MARQRIGEPITPPRPNALHMRILMLLGAGATCDAVARQVHLSTRSVYREIAKLKLAIGASSIPALIATASRHGWLDGELG